MTMLRWALPFLVTLVGCFQRQSIAPLEAATPAANDAPVVVFLVPLSGISSHDGDEVFSGATLARSSPSAHGFGVPDFDLKAVDANGALDDVISRFRTNALQRQVIAVVLSTTEDALVAPRIRQVVDAPILSLSMPSAKPPTDKTADVFFVQPQSFERARVLATYCKEMGWLHYFESTEATTSLNDIGYSVGFYDTLDKLGGAQVSKSVWHSNSVSYGRQAAKVASAAADVVFISSSEREGLSMAGEIRRAGVATPIVGGATWRPDALAKSNLSDILIATDYYAEDSRNQGFVSDFKKEFGTTPSRWAALGYDATGVLAMSMQAGGSLEDALEKGDFHDPRLATGGFRFDADRLPTEKTCVILRSSAGSVIVEAHAQPPPRS